MVAKEISLNKWIQEGTPGPVTSPPPPPPPLKLATLTTVSWLLRTGYNSIDTENDLQPKQQYEIESVLLREKITSCHNVIGLAPGRSFSLRLCRKWDLQQQECALAYVLFSQITRRTTVWKFVYLNTCLVEKGRMISMMITSFKEQICLHCAVIILERVPIITEITPWLL